STVGAGLPPNNLVGLYLDMNTPGVSFLDLFGHDGDDVFDVPGNSPFDGGVLIDGGNPSASDIVNFTGDGTGDVTLDLDTPSITEAGFAPVTFTGVEVLNADAGAAAITVVGSAIADDIAVTPTGTDTATLTHAGQNLVVN